MTPHDDATAPDAAPSLRAHLLAIVALLALTAATVGAAAFELGRWGDVLAAALATAKATVVVCVFMHVRRAPRSVRLVVGAAVAWVLLLVGLTLADTLTR